MVGCRVVAPQPMTALSMLVKTRSFMEPGSTAVMTVRFATETTKAVPSSSTRASVEPFAAAASTPALSRAWAAGVDGDAAPLQPLQRVAGEPHRLALLELAAQHLVEAGPRRRPVGRPRGAGGGTADAGRLQRGIVSDRIGHRIETVSMLPGLICSLPTVIRIEPSFSVTLDAMPEPVRAVLSRNVTGGRSAQCSATPGSRRPSVDVLGPCS